ncbi:hypothetical protein [Nocardioides alcanivorans]|uniref:hypothetical protein n=1 Tax=Nocardioides alcanivorans TaxID=2897352 RepID=UPI001F325ECB|nr:hypothetical protein [Nocardioides alcanivorans]
MIAHAHDGKVDAVLPAGEVVHRGDRLVVVQLTGAVDPTGDDQREWLLVVDLGVLVILATLILPLGRFRGYSHRRESDQHVRGGTT